jgi:hypothetical protein
MLFPPCPAYARDATSTSATSSICCRAPLVQPTHHGFARIGGHAGEPGEAIPAKGGLDHATFTPPQLSLAGEDGPG